ncbi:hypothetical protein [Flavobacterium sp. J27]|uniref:hypothetical protein n=1 Tax=Flavobacterium sp. J27 TaxID=2060419 RepID=UPI001030CCF9|nr:hypothetical protein [Flavobacterium sp. J27]
MKKKKIMLFSFLILLLNNGCNSPKFYNEIKRMYFKEKLTHNSLKKDINKELFKRIQDRLVQTEHIIYYYQPDYSVSDNNFSGIILDVDNGIYFYIKRKNINEIIIDTIPNSAYSKYQIDNINLFINNEKEKLKKMGDKCTYSGVNVYDNIYEIDLVKNMSNKFYFKNYFYCLDVQ